MTNHYLKSAFELACQISLETDPEKKKHLVRSWRKQMDQYFSAIKFARDAHV